ncbi:putative quinol monooxygenase [Amaricoccus solimangrovi]|uniref:Antibiotic biosynthesis monooxygenase n=1 Tax=Amaricoccus solimangrovi TaxID=2589815 RepID=A0A501WGZ9_9RHOB|nr:putative quinol monooxygenase [Amaricoccus solimangrovi]TPE48859.1 antibiotic biosynthesis monooxygenase [Amaricoccus solimangrovi]
MILIEGTIRVAAGRLAEARPAMARIVEASRAEPGCVAYSFAEDILEPGLIRIFEVWRDEAALELHRAAEHFRLWRGSWAELGIGGRDLRRAEIETLEPC